MSKRKLALAAGALVLIGGAAVAAVGQRDGRFESGRGDGTFELAQAAGPEMGDDRGGRSAGPRHFQRERDPEMRRGWFSRSLTADEFDARTRERFARFDKNGDGVIDKAEVEAELSRATEGRAGMRERMRERFAGSVDADRDGKITRQEATDRARRTFSRLDLNGDGQITDADLPPMMRGRGVLKGEPTAMRGRGGAFGLDRLVAADANKDGIITQDEFVAAALARFDLADVNKDGVIDKADRDAMAKAMTDYRVQRFLHANGGGKDGRVTRDQFLTTAKQRFAERDFNNDGRIDREDGPRGRMQGGPGGPGMGDQSPRPR